MADVNFELVTPEALIFSGPADMVVVPGGEGDFGVLAGHAPLMSTVRPGFVEIHKGNSVERVFVAGGFADVNPSGLTVLAEEAMKPEDVNAAVFDRLIAAAEKDVERASGDVESANARQRVADLQQIRTQLHV
jgi:F-type H+-transporting ATPase subunit epsilon